MEVEVVRAPFVVFSDCVGYFWVCTSGKFKQSGLKRLISGAIFDENGQQSKWSTIWSAKMVSQKNQNGQQFFLLQN